MLTGDGNDACPWSEGLHRCLVRDEGLLHPSFDVAGRDVQSGREKIISEEDHGIEHPAIGGGRKTCSSTVQCLARRHHRAPDVAEGDDDKRGWAPGPFLGNGRRRRSG